MKESKRKKSSLRKWEKIIEYIKKEKSKNYRYSFWSGCSYCFIAQEKGNYEKGKAIHCIKDCTLSKKSYLGTHYCLNIGDFSHGYLALKQADHREFKEALKNASMILNAIKRDIKKTIKREEGENAK